MTACVCGAAADPGICDGRGCPLGGHSHCLCAHGLFPEITDPPVTLPTLDQLRAHPGHVTLDDRRPAPMPDPVIPPPDLIDPEARYLAAWQVGDVLNRRGLGVTVQAALEAVDAVLAAVAVPAAELPGEARVRALLEAAAGATHLRVDDVAAALGAHPDHVHHWQAWRDTAPVHCFTDGAAA